MFQLCYGQLFARPEARDGSSRPGKPGTRGTSVAFDPIGDRYAHTVVRRGVWTLVGALDGPFEHVVLDLAHKHRSIAQSLPNPSIPGDDSVLGNPFSGCFDGRSFCCLLGGQCVGASQQQDISDWAIGCVPEPTGLVGVCVGRRFPGRTCHEHHGNQSQPGT